jgi:hypothetical protein
LELITDFVLNLGGNNLKEYGFIILKRSGELLENREYLKEISYDLNALNALCIHHQELLQCFYIEEKLLILL